ncbi:MAG: proline--tRNA ligase [Patescibacteria group bacterium]|jgi:prolyl-tRNA synthetase
MRYSKSLIKTQRETPKEADNISSALLLRGGYIDQEMSGVYSLLPLGWRVITKISQIIREEMDAIGGQEIFLPALQPKELWEESGRWNTMDPPLLKLKDRHDKELALGSTHEEVIVDLVQDRISSFKELPQMLYQIQTKFRNEQRFTGGLLRTKEFLMKDAYSFHADQKEFEAYYEKVIIAYRKIFKRMGRDVHLVSSHSGSIGGKKSNEFMLLSETGENTIYICGACDYAVNVELTSDLDKCPSCGGAVKSLKAIEIAHIFMLDDLYSKKMNAAFTDSDGKMKNFIMGCYGIGIPRLMAAIVEVSHDDYGIIWPESIAPFKTVLIDLTDGKADKVYEKMVQSGLDVLYDDRETAAGVKFADADLLGIPYRLVVSEKTGEKIEVKKRTEKETKILAVDEVIAELLR